MTTEEEIKARVGQTVAWSHNGSLGVIEAYCVRPSSKELVYIDLGGWFVVEFRDGTKRELPGQDLLIEKDWVKSLSKPKKVVVECPVLRLLFTLHSGVDTQAVYNNYEGPYRERPWKQFVIKECMAHFSDAFSLVGRMGYISRLGTDAVEDAFYDLCIQQNPELSLERAIR